MAKLPDQSLLDMQNLFSNTSIWLDRLRRSQVVQTTRSGKQKRTFLHWKVLLLTVKIISLSARNRTFQVEVGRMNSML
jgi:hypothetical protein